MQVLRPSGVDFLDDEAAAAFRRAQPFLFAFIFDLSGKASFRVFKY